VETLSGYLTKLASDAPAPGGGSAAMVVGAAGCALVAMAARICARSKKCEAVHPLAVRLAAQADALRERMAQLREQDETAFEAVVAARGDKTAMQTALLGAAAAPLNGALAALEALGLAQDALQLGNANLVSDVGCAGEFAYAALTACAYNVRINHKFMHDAAAAAQQRAQLTQLERQAQAALERIRAGVRALLMPPD
jgi:formiminotetrahydrofolate cyclodeaminase